MNAATTPPAQRADQSAVRDLVCRVVVEQCRQRFGDGLRAVILTGSMARDEATILVDGKRLRLLGDADFVLLFHERAKLAKGETIALLSDTCEAQMLAEGLIAHAGLAVVHEDYLRKLPVGGFTYELREYGRVVWGDAQALRLAPKFKTSAIELEDGWRTLSNRMVEWLGSAPEVVEDPAICSLELHYRTVKLYLDMATSLLIFLHAYAPTYAERARCLEELARTSSIEGPFPLARLARRVSQSTAWKLGQPGANSDLRPEFWREAAEFACSLWRWEIARMSRLASGLPLHELFYALAERQTGQEKLRGWMYVLRAEGWLRSWRSWPRWLAMARGGTPRFYVYGAVYELIAQLSGMNEELDTELPGGASAGYSWPAQVFSALDNYNRFVRETRA